MRVGIVGAAGSAARRLARDLLELPDLELLVVVDRSAETAEAISSLDKRKARPVAISLESASLSEVLSDCELVVGTSVDPGDHALAADAALRAGAHYLSGSDHPETYRALDAKDEAARGAGVAVVPGAGWTPAITGALARLALEEIPVRELRVAWVVSAVGPAADEALARAAWSLSGRPVDEVFFPEPLGWQRVGPAGGLESQTFPKSFQGVERVSVTGGLDRSIPSRLAGALTSRADGFSKTPAALVLRRLGRARDTWASARVDGLGSDGSRTAFAIVDQLTNLMTSPLIVTAQMMLRGEAKGAGSTMSHDLLEPRAFLDGLAERGVRTARLQ